MKNNKVKMIKNVTSADNDNTRKVYIVLSMTGTFSARLIRFYTGEPYSHVSIAFDDDLAEMYSFARKRLKHPFDAGFVTEKVDSGVFGFYKDITKCSIYQLEVTQTQYRLIRREVDHFRKNSTKYSYNFIGIFGAMIHMPIEKENKFICSQFVAHILEKSGVKIFKKNCALVRPFDFRTCSRLHKIYEGKLIEYRDWYYSHNVLCMDER